MSRLPALELQVTFDQAGDAMLEQLRDVLQNYERRAKRDRDTERVAVVQQLLRLSCGDDRVDLDQLVESWLALVRPRWRAAVHESPRRRSLRRLRGLDKTLEQQPFSTEELTDLVDSVRVAKPLAERVVAAIIGVPGA